MTRVVTYSPYVSGAYLKTTLNTPLQVSPARLASEPCPARSASMYGAGGFAVGLAVDRAFSSQPTPSDGLADADAEGVEPAGRDEAEFPADVFDSGDVLQSEANVHIKFLRVLLPLAKRVLVHAVRRGCANAEHAESFGVYMLDHDGNEHLILEFFQASSAVYAAMRMGQTYRLGVEFGNFSRPKCVT
ncbi:hypothetical protein [Trinickia fusca]|uniref:Uncharacterized protein n=1 Tax=Trinickia fusca TaxID=2419777 RepID=A0A494XAA5_9BURK|nr:hypothetical protein [Trinickia fusca]RKP47410.1 hypothetical protein D7S89_14230 [Trinickia fusca]